MARRRTPMPAGSRRSRARIVSADMLRATFYSLRGALCNLMFTPNTRRGGTRLTRARIERMNYIASRPRPISASSTRSRDGNRRAVAGAVVMEILLRVPPCTGPLPSP